MRRLLVPVAAALLAAGYLAGLLATGDALFELGLAVPAAPRPALAHTAIYSAAAMAISAPAVTANPVPPVIAPVAAAPLGSLLGVAAASTNEVISKPGSAAVCVGSHDGHLDQCVNLKGELPPTREPRR